MKKLIILPLLAGALVLSGCGKQESAASSASANPAAPAVALIELTANDAMKFNLKTFEVKAGQEVKLTLTNMGTMPKAVMGHNVIILKQGADAKEFANAAVMATATEYVPAALADQIIAHTKLLGPKQSEEITFMAPMEPGECTFLCSFPAHFLAGMTGVMIVK